MLYVNNSHIKCVHPTLSPHPRPPLLYPSSSFVLVLPSTHGFSPLVLSHASYLLENSTMRNTETKCSWPSCLPAAAHDPLTLCEWQMKLWSTLAITLGVGLTTIALLVGTKTSSFRFFVFIVYISLFERGYPTPYGGAAPLWGIYRIDKMLRR